MKPLCLRDFAASREPCLYAYGCEVRGAVGPDERVVAPALELDVLLEDELPAL